jgi:hypothetical protein
MAISWWDYVGIMDFDNVALIDSDICMAFFPPRRESILLFVPCFCAILILALHESTNLYPSFSSLQISDSIN